ncbi:alpha-mannosidase [Paenibacillus sp. LMG 31456]|uniref:Alpha-mannosidase n=1 Tax=Paenibacillus foliorum TaxID=2654974 RepID=A0A972K3N2_9BACL|nr:alpha-mannosidase [Paenibacillus foliorum]NOU96098.1 alpha-mannosidase [Paenibacillus foliorum]
MSEGSKIHLIGNAHLDPVWLWRWQEGYAEIKATFQSALDRMEEFPDFIFTCACAAYYKWVEENAPEMFAEIRERVAEGRWVITGGWWIQPDCNLPSGESFARHGLYGQRYFLEKFGVMARVGYNVDSFGHHGMMPQLLKQCGMDYYLFMRPEAHEKQLPNDLFWWESEDGSRVMTFRLSDSYANWAGNNLEGKIVKHKQRAETDGHAHMSFYGVGNHGGGPTVANLRLIKEIRERHGQEDILLSSPNRYFEEMVQINPLVPVIKDEMQRHAIGCYSSHSESKAYNRKVEHRLLSAEKFSSYANLLLGLPYPAEPLKQAWENVMFNQFHDIMGGCSVKEAFDDVRDFYGEALSLGAKALNAALQKLSWSIDTMKPEVKSLSKDKDWQLWEQDDLGTPLVVFNPLSWEVEAPLQINRKLASVTDESGVSISIQEVRASRTNGKDKWDTLITARIPAFGYRVYWVYLNKEAQSELPMLIGAVQADANSLENNKVRIELDPNTGYIQRLFDKRANREVLNGSGAVPVVINELHSDTWGHGLSQYRDEMGRFADAEVKVLENGPLRGTIRVTSRYNGSLLRQDISLSNDSSDIQVKVKLDWREQHAMLKLAFPVNVEQPRTVSEIPYGFIERSVNGDEVPGQQWVDVFGIAAGTESVQGKVTSTDIPPNLSPGAAPNSELGTEPGAKSSLETGQDHFIYGMALLNDAKYGYDVLGNELRMTVVRSPIYADHFGERDEQVEYMDQGIQEFAYTLSPHSGDWREGDVVRKAYELNVPLLQIWETYHTGILPQLAEGIIISSKHVVAAAFKLAESGEGWIVRCYETSGIETEAALELPALKRKWSCQFGKCEIKTFLIPFDPEAAVKEVNFIEIE